MWSLECRKSISFAARDLKNRLTAVTSLRRPVVRTGSSGRLRGWLEMSVMAYPSFDLPVWLVDEATLAGRWAPVLKRSETLPK
jgi:hypothetical protein